MKSFLKVFLIIILSMGVAGGGTYYFLNSSYNDKLGSLESQLSEAQRAVDYYSNLASSVSAEEIAGWSTYTNDKYGYSMKYGSGWTAGSEQDTVASKIPISTVAFANKDVYGDGQVSVEVSPYTDGDISQWANNLSVSDPDKTYDVSDITIAGIAGKTLYSATQGGMVRSAVIKGGNIYIITLTYATDQQNIADLDGAYQAMVSTFKLK